MSLQNVVRWILPREDQFYGYLERQSELAQEAALVLARLQDSSLAPEAIRDEAAALEHKADDVLHSLEEALARTFVTPIDREDLQRLARRLDDVVDLVDLTARSFVLFGVRTTSQPMKALIDKLVECTGLLKATLPKLRAHQYNDIVESGRQVQELEHEADVLFRNAIGTLFRDPTIDAKVLLREKEVLEDLENAMDRCSSVARTLTSIAVKNG